MTSLPSGTVTFPFTDVERSTQTVCEVDDERYADLQDIHRKLLREAFAMHKSVEVGTEGNAFFVAFARAGKAVNAAVDGQRSLAQRSELRVRMGLHTGEALVRESEYVVHDVHKAKRVCGAGDGGRILLSQTTADLVGTTTALRNLGPHPLKDRREPQRLYQVVADALARDFPPLRSLESFSNNLPLSRSTSVGREHEIAAIAHAVEGLR